jgi:hypothetical protein
MLRGRQKRIRPVATGANGALIQREMGKLLGPAILPDNPITALQNGEMSIFQLSFKGYSL